MHVNHGLNIQGIPSQFDDENKYGSIKQTINNQV